MSDWGLTIPRKGSTKTLETRRTNPPISEQTVPGLTLSAPSTPSGSGEAYPQNQRQEIQTQKYSTTESIEPSNTLIEGAQQYEGVQPHDSSGPKHAALLSEERASSKPFESEETEAGNRKAPSDANLGGEDSFSPAPSLVDTCSSPKPAIPTYIGNEPHWLNTFLADITFPSRNLRSVNHFVPKFIFS